MISSITLCSTVALGASVCFVLLRLSFTSFFTTFAWVLVSILDIDLDSMLDNVLHFLDGRPHSLFWDISPRWCHFCCLSWPLHWQDMSKKGFDEIRCILPMMVIVTGLQVLCEPLRTCIWLVVSLRYLYRNIAFRLLRNLTLQIPCKISYICKQTIQISCAVHKQKLTCISLLCCARTRPWQVICCGGPMVVADFLETSLHRRLTSNTIFCCPQTSWPLHLYKIDNFGTCVTCHSSSWLIDGMPCSDVLSSQNSLPDWQNSGYHSFFPYNEIVVSFYKFFVRCVTNWFDSRHNEISMIVTFTWPLQNAHILCMCISFRQKRYQNNKFKHPMSAVYS